MSADPFAFQGMAQTGGCCEVADEGLVRAREEAGPGWDRGLGDKAALSHLAKGLGEQGIVVREEMHGQEGRWQREPKALVGLHPLGTSLQEMAFSRQCGAASCGSFPLCDCSGSWNGVPATVVTP